MAERIVRHGMAANLTVALTQLQPVMANKKINLDKAASYIEEAATKKADMIIFPELYLTGYACGEKPGLFYQLSEPIPGPATDTLVEYAKKYNLYIIMGMPEANTVYPGLIHNSAVLVGPEGVVGVFRKIHLPTWEASGCKEILYGFTPGDEIPVFELKQKWKIGILICYDTWFPEAARVAVLKGADLLITISAGPSKSEAGWHLVNQIRAMENTIFHVYSNIVGEEWGGLSFFGKAMAFGPDGKHIATGPKDKEAMFIATLNASDLYKARRDHPHLRNRRPSAYREIPDFTYPHM